MPSYNPNAPNPPARDLRADVVPAAEIARLLGGDGAISSDGWCRCACPVHGGSGPNLSLKLVEPDRLIVRCWSRQCDPRSILGAIDQRLGTQFAHPAAAVDFSDDATPGAPIGADADPATAEAALWHAEAAGYEAALRAESVRAAAEQVFAAATPIERGDLVDLYLRRRGILLKQYPAALRLHPGLWHAETQSTWPCLVTRITTGGGRFMAMHRTFLDGATATKAPVDPVRKLFSPMRGGAVRLFDPGGDQLLVAEGIETTLAALLLSRWSFTGWAGLSTSGLIALRLPPRFRRVLIAGDNDSSGAGLRAARTLARRLRATGRRVDIRLPPCVGSDWNDVLVEQMEQGAAP